MNLAPNGKKSNLTKEQYKLVRTDAFKNWFGDWENDAKNSSKVVDENGEPLVVYHGTNSDFTVFEKSTRGAFGKGFYFTQDLKEAKGYGKKLLKVFVNMKKSATPQQVQDIMLSIEDYRYLEDIVVSKIITENLIKSDFDGVIFEYPNKDKFVVALNPNQIKLADGTNTTFDANNNDIRYKNGGNMETEYKVMFESRSGSGNVREVKVMAKNFNDAKKKGWVKSGLNKKFYAFLTAHEIKELGGLMATMQIASTGLTLHHTVKSFNYSIGGL
jgi:hypothetical protein